MSEVTCLNECVEAQLLGGHQDSIAMPLLLLVIPLGRSFVLCLSNDTSHIPDSDAPYKTT